jgi:methylglutamate dehydrogenase subunit D
MLELRSAVNAAPHVGKQAELSEAPDFVLTQVAGSDASLQRAFANMPSRVGLAVTSGAQTLLRIGPKQVWILGTVPKSTTDIYVTPLSSSRTRFHLSGAGARDVLANCCAIDFSPKVFRPGQFVMTGIHHTPVLIHCIAENEFHIYAMRTFAHAVWDWLCDVMI